MLSESGIDVAVFAARPAGLTTLLLLLASITDPLRMKDCSLKRFVCLETILSKLKYKIIYIYLDHFVPGKEKYNHIMFCNIFVLLDYTPETKLLKL